MENKQVDIYDLSEDRKFLMIPFSVIRTKMYANWSGTAEARVWFRLITNSIRSPMKSALGNMIYKKYYKNGLICAHVNQEILADKMNKSTSTISELITGLEKNGIIKKHKERWNNTNIIVYELGTHDKTVSRHENMHLFSKAMESEVAAVNSGKIMDVSDFI